MGDLSERRAWRRYQRGLRTLPVISVVSIVIWAATGGGYFWPRWVLLWAAVAMALRAMRAMRLAPPAEDPHQLQSAPAAAVVASRAHRDPFWSP